MKKYLLFYLILTLILAVNINDNVYAQKWILAGQIVNLGQSPSISVVDANNVWIAGGSPDTPRVYRTTNGGINWIQISTAGISTEIYCLWATNPSRVFVGEGILSGNARLFMTTNAGENWNAVIQTGPGEGYFNGLIFSTVNADIGAALAEKLYLTTNGGINWSTISTGGSGVYSAQNSLMLVDKNFFGFGLKNGASRVKITTNSGTGWLVQNINLTGNYTSGFSFKDDKLTGLASTSLSMPYLSRTTNGGITWTPVDIDSGLSGKTLIRWVAGTDVVYIVGENGAIKRSTDNGLSWISLYTAGVNGITHFSFIRINHVIHGYAVSSSGNIIKLADSLLILTGSNNFTHEIPSETKLYQNYPNPFNPATNIKFQINESKFVSLKIYNLLGQEVAALVNKRLTQGTYEVNWNASGFASGVYFSQLSIDNLKHSMVRMVLIK